MQPFTNEFLTQLAEQYELSPKEKEAFIACVINGKTNFKAADTLYIRESALKTRMTGLYIKCGINGKGHNLSQLHDWVLEKSQNPNSSRVPVFDDELIQKVRKAIQPLIKERCDSMRVLDMNQPISLHTIYVRVNILEKITGRRRLKLAELMQDLSPETFNQFK